MNHTTNIHIKVHAFWSGVLCEGSLVGSLAAVCSAIHRLADWYSGWLGVAASGGSTGYLLGSTLLNIVRILAALF